MNLSLKDLSSVVFLFFYDASLTINICGFHIVLEGSRTANPSLGGTMATWHMTAFTKRDLVEL